ncbi:hypothetical protein RJ641_004725, partial [Dillenia turbinata]
MSTNTTTVVDRYNVETAEFLASEALRLPISEAVPIYEQLLAAFPTAAKYWKQYVEAHMAVNNDDAIKLLFSRCLLNCLQIPLWRCYIRFIRNVNDKKGVEGQEETRKAYDFMLSYIGSDIAAGPAVSPQEESQRMTAVRKAYQKAIVTPTHHLEQLWKDYENFENSVSRTLAKGLLSEYQPKYNSARAVYRERKKYVDEIDLNMLAVPPTGLYKEEVQWMAWKRLLAFEKGNPQRIDSSSSQKRISFTYEQCLMYLYHYPDIWYDYATWHAKNGSIDAAIKVFQRAVKALPDSELLRYAYAELEESCGAIQPAKQIYEGMQGDGVNTTPLAHIQFMRFLRRTEGGEAARKYFLDARKSPSCTYHVYVAYAMMAFCLDKDPKIAHNVFEAGLNHFMHEPGYILEYADFLSRLNDDRNIRALFERALSSLAPEQSVEVWKRFVQFEQTYGDLASVLKVEQRRKEALSGVGEDGASTLENSLHDIVSRYSFMDLWPCSSKGLDNLAHQEWLARNINKKTEKSVLHTGAGILADAGLSTVSSTLSTPSVPLASGNSNTTSDQLLKATPPALVAFLSNLPAVEGPLADVDFVLSICLQSDIPTGQVLKSGTSATQLPTVVVPSTSDLSSSRKSHSVPVGSVLKQAKQKNPAKRKDIGRQEDDDTATVQSQPLPKDVFRIRQIQKARGGTTSQTGSVSYGSAVSGELSGSTSLLYVRQNMTRLLPLLVLMRIKEEHAEVLGELANYYGRGRKESSSSIVLLFSEEEAYLTSLSKVCLYSVDR